jgi:flagellar biosynthesis protein FlhB
VAKDDKTEKPTPKRRKELRKKGQVAKSQDVSAWLVMLVATFLLPTIFRAADKRLMSLMGQVGNVIASPSPAGAMGVLQQGLLDFIEIALPVAAVFAIVGVVANVAQTGLYFSPAAAKPKWKKINPISGVKNLFSIQSVWQLGKQLVKLLVLVVIAYAIVSHLAHSIVGSQPVDMAPLIDYAGSRILGMARDVSAVALLLGIGDYAWQRHHLEQTMKMSKQDIKDERRQAEGDPLVKGKIKGKMRQMSRARMIAAVAGADVVIVNPTHYAVALRYDPSRSQAPVVVANGSDELALRIKEEASDKKVPVVEDPPLARAVYAACELEQAIPPELFLAVARLLAFVFTLSPIVRAAGIVHRRSASAMVA